MSGETLAHRVGYKNQSAISNLENRAGGTGGNRIGQIADALNVPVDWLLRGPDSDEVPFVSSKMDAAWPAADAAGGHTAQELSRPDYAVDPILREAHALLSKMSPAGREQSIAYLRFMATQHAAQPPSAGGERDSIPQQKAA